MFLIILNVFLLVDIGRILQVASLKYNNYQLMLFKII